MSRIREIELLHVGLPLRRPFRTSFGVSTAKECVLARVRTDGAEGWGECVADDASPGSRGSGTRACGSLLRDVLGPALLRCRRRDRRHGRGRAGVRPRQPDGEGDPGRRGRRRRAPRRGPLAGVVPGGATRDRVACGVSIGIADTTEELRAQVDGYLEQGYQRIKLKIEPGHRRGAGRRRSAPTTRTSCCPSMRTRRTRSRTARCSEALDEPRAADGRAAAAPRGPGRARRRCRRAIRTALCLDESIRSAADARAAIGLGACRIVNIKQGRVGGVLEARRVHDVCAAAGIPVWCGGMLETGVGRATNLALGVHAELHAPRRHERVVALLPRGPDGAVRPGAGRHDGRPDRPRDRGRTRSGSAGGCDLATRADRSMMHVADLVGEERVTEPASRLTLDPGSVCTAS